MNENDKGGGAVEKPRVCCLDIDDSICETLKHRYQDVYAGTLGSKINIPNKYGQSHRILIDNKFPRNFHEYDVYLIDLDYSNTIDYQASEHIRITSDQSELYITSSFPQKIFDPRPFASYLLGRRFEEVGQKQHLIVAFSSRMYEQSYSFEVVKKNGSEILPSEEYSIYSFADDLPLSKTKEGKEIFLVDLKNNEIQRLLERGKSGTRYNQTFTHPEAWYEKGGYKKNEDFFPLMTNANNEIIAFLWFSRVRSIIILPQIQNKSYFITEFLDGIAPSFWPELFPFSKRNSWKEQKEYWLPKYSSLLQERINIQKEFDRKISDTEEKIVANKSKYSFLHEILTESGDNLVKALITFLKWLEFDEVIDYDSIKQTSNILEEDIQVLLPNGLLVIECKGIGGTSSDSDCSQVYKIKNRRSRERNKFDVWALYIVNHQRFIPPLKRNNPPFTHHQIQDALNDERGLLTTWQLFNLYSEIENGIITKNKARDSIIQYGLIEFKPKNLVFIFEPTQMIPGKQICRVQLNNNQLKIHDELFIENNGKYEKVKVLEIQQDGQQLQEVKNGDVGLKLNKDIPKKTKLWKRMAF